MSGQKRAFLLAGICCRSDECVPGMQSGFVRAGGLVPTAAPKAQSERERGATVSNRVMMTGNPYFVKLMGGNPANWLILFQTPYLASGCKSLIRLNSGDITESANPLILSGNAVGALRWKLQDFLEFLESIKKGDTSNVTLGNVPIKTQAAAWPIEKSNRISSYGKIMPFSPRSRIPLSSSLRTSVCTPLTSRPTRLATSLIDSSPAPAIVLSMFTHLGVSILCNSSQLTNDRKSPRYLSSPLMAAIVRRLVSSIVETSIISVFMVLPPVIVHIVPEIGEQLLKAFECGAYFIVTDVLVVAFTGLIVITDNADIIYNVGQTVFITVVTGSYWWRNLPDDDFNQGICANKLFYLMYLGCWHLSKSFLLSGDVNHTNTKGCCQLLQQWCEHEQSSGSAGGLPIKKGTTANDAFGMNPFLLHEVNQSASLIHRLLRPVFGLRGLSPEFLGDWVSVLVGCSGSDFRCSFGALRNRRLISPCIAVTMNCPELSPGSFTLSIPSTMSCGILAAKVCDFALTAFVAITGILINWCLTVCMKGQKSKYLTCSTLAVRLVLNTLMYLKCSYNETRQCGDTNRASNHNANRGNTMAIHHSTQTQFKFLFLAVNRADMSSLPHRETVTAPDELTARRLLAPYFILSLAARLPVEANHV